MPNPIEWTAKQKEAALKAIHIAETKARFGSATEAQQPAPITKIGVIGGGTMGAGIAVGMLNSGLSVHMIERDAPAVDAGKARVLDTLKRDRASGRIDKAEYAARESAFKASAQYSDLTDVDLVVEAVYEDIDVKRDVFRQVSEACGDDVILATNTSYLNPELIFKDVPAPQRCIGLHFFSPANIMKLVEIIPTKTTAKDVLSTAFSLTRTCKKVPVQAGICDGFIGNRILKAMRTQAERVLLFGATPQSVDAALKEFGMKMGPFEVQDLAGLDIAAYQRKAARDRGEKVFSPVSDHLVDQGRFGRKTGAGWYDYAGTEQVFDTPEPVKIALGAARQEAKVEPILWTNAMIVEVVVFAMLDEAAQILDEGIAQDPSDIDLVEIYGYGFPKDRGGLAWFGSAYGLSKIVERLEHYNKLNVSEAPSNALRNWAQADA
ncbi:3-hydroxyacyl-CoA dehydrogenase [Thalassovita sp.]|uniref:3-hydroxyacyl-CoA dehydrogenase n=1 Tax=Thalassovita sp. TaxID=1979401 RepID=UPI002880F955|nr:3-hydroxyacyl-CoA dehydrogenase NAD-binding domain-containing protein [Thalassovita sp.]MDF1804236.1 3-hydroxyacyl-CoA dehydrogenase NAD-binding domain-containing protein [Thalassovita sp.]